MGSGLDGRMVDPTPPILFACTMHHGSDNELRPWAKPVLADLALQLTSKIGGAETYITSNYPNQLGPS